MDVATTSSWSGVTQPHSTHVWAGTRPLQKAASAGLTVTSTSSSSPNQASFGDLQSSPKADSAMTNKDSQRSANETSNPGFLASTSTTTTNSADEQRFVVPRINFGDWTRPSAPPMTVITTQDVLRDPDIILTMAIARGWDPSDNTTIWSSMPAYDGLNSGGRRAKTLETRDTIDGPMCPSSNVDDPAIESIQFASNASIDIAVVDDPTSPATENNEPSLAKPSSAPQSLESSFQSILQPETSPSCQWTPSSGESQLQYDDARLECAPLLGLRKRDANRRVGIGIRETTPDDPDQARITSAIPISGSRYSTIQDTESGTQSSSPNDQVVSSARPLGGLTMSSSAPLSRGWRTAMRPAISPQISERNIAFGESTLVQCNPSANPALLDR